MFKTVLGVNPIQKKIIIRYSHDEKLEWEEGNVYSFVFDESKCTHMTDSNPNWDELRTELISYSGDEITGTFTGYSRVDNKAVWIVDLVQIRREYILNKILK